MKKLLIISICAVSIIAIFIVSQFIYLKFFTYKVLPSDRAIIIEDGHVSGDPKKPGLHKINPFTQKVNFIDVERLREWKGVLSLKTRHSVRVLWKVGNPIIYYEASKKTNVVEEVDKQFTAIAGQIQENFSESEIETISNMKSKNWNYSDRVLNEIYDIFQAKVDKYGVEIYRVDIIK